ncbi:MAG: gamma-glutamyltransferase family protein [Beijerinckiaceae bacterium]|jgi:gamma-glutamyltranspeptidase/glutathione hydrolase|nr:gamma-glutamyltransferase family protein [Beijerinckiaceae bacterium]
MVFTSPIFTTRPEIRGSFGVVSATHWLAASAGMGVLERGGNAFDAAVTAGFVLQVVEPHQNGLGGEVPALCWSSEKREIDVICGQGPAPAGATISYFRNLGLDLIPGSGLLPACIPGAFDAWCLILRDYGTLTLSDVLAPAIHYAEAGFPITPWLRETLGVVRQVFNKEWPTSAATYLVQGEVPVTSFTRNTQLAATYRRLAAVAEAAKGSRETRIEAARREWAEGFVADAVDEFYRTQILLDSSGRRHGGILTGQDMAGFRASVEKPVTFDYRGYSVAKCGPWGQGPVFLQNLALLAGFELDGLDPNGPDFIHTIIECSKLAYADREAWYGDPNFIDVPLQALLSSGYNAERRRLVSEHASLDLRPGSPDGRIPRLPSLPPAGPVAKANIASFFSVPSVEDSDEASAAHAMATTAVRGDTVHLDVADRFGNAISAMPSGGWLQSSPVVPELGFCINARAQMFWLDENSPSALAPGKRPRTTLTPTMALRDGEFALAFGTPGGDQQDQWSLRFFLNHVHGGMNLQEANDAPAFHIDHFPSSFYPRRSFPGQVVVESRFPPETIAELERRGHRIIVVDPWAEGHVCAVASEREGETRVLKACASPRAIQNYAVGR